MVCTASTAMTKYGQNNNEKEHGFVKHKDKAFAKRSAIGKTCQDMHQKKAGRGKNYFHGRNCKKCKRACRLANKGKRSSSKMRKHRLLPSQLQEAGGSRHQQKVLEEPYKEVLEELNHQVLEETGQQVLEKTDQQVLDQSYHQGWEESFSSWEIVHLEKRQLRKKQTFANAKEDFEIVNFDERPLTRINSLGDEPLTQSTFLSNVNTSSRQDLYFNDKSLPKVTYCTDQVALAKMPDCWVEALKNVDSCNGIPCYTPTFFSKISNTKTEVLNEPILLPYNRRIFQHTFRYYLKKRKYRDDFLKRIDINVLVYPGNRLFHRLYHGSTKVAKDNNLVSAKKIPYKQHHLKQILDAFVKSFKRCGYVFSPETIFSVFNMNYSI